MLSFAIAWYKIHIPNLEVILKWIVDGFVHYEFKYTQVWIHLDTASNALIYDYANQLIGKIVLNLEQTSLCTGMF